MADHSINRKFGVDIDFNSKDKATPVIDRLTDRLDRMGKTMDAVSRTLEGLTAIVGLSVVSNMGRFANEVTEIDNRLHLLNTTVVDTKMGFFDLVEASNRSRTSLQSFSELFTRIGMSSGHFFARPGAEGGLLRYIETLNKQFQMMHLLPSQMLSVQTSILDAMELGYFDWRHMKAGLAHDNPLFRGYLNSIMKNQESGMDIPKASRNRMFTAESFITYVLEQSETINQQFDQMKITIQQFGTIMKNEVVASFKDTFDLLTGIVNRIYRGYTYLSRYHPNIVLFLRSLIQSLGILSGVVLTMNSVVFLIRSATALMSVFNVLSGPIGWMGLALAGAGLTAGGFLYKKSQLSKKTEDLPSTNITEILRSIQSDTHELVKGSDATQDKLSDMVERTESMLIRIGIQRENNLDGNPDLLRQYLDQVMDSSGS